MSYPFVSDRIKSLNRNQKVRTSTVRISQYLLPKGRMATATVPVLTYSQISTPSFLSRGSPIAVSCLRKLPITQAMSLSILPYLPPDSSTSFPLTALGRLLLLFLQRGSTLHDVPYCKSLNIVKREIEPGKAGKGWASMEDICLQKLKLQDESEKGEKERNFQS